MILKYVAIFLVVYITLFAAGYWLLRLVAVANSPKQRIFDRACGENVRDPYREAESDPWFERIGRADRRTLKLGKLKLSAAFIPGETPHRYVLCCHDYATDGRYTAPYAHLFHQRGASLLIPDARACGHSTGTLLGMGYAERAEVKAWVRMLTEEDSMAEIWLFGLGTGAAAELFYVSKRPDDHVKGVIADSCYAGLWEVLQAHLLPTLRAFAKVVGNFANTEYMLCAGIRNNWHKADLWDQIHGCHIPILLIHGEEDYLFPIKHFEVLQEKIQSPLTTLRVPRAGHVACLAENAASYTEVLDAFLSIHD